MKKIVKDCFGLPVTGLAEQARSWLDTPISFAELLERYPNLSQFRYDVHPESDSKVFVVAAFRTRDLIAAMEWDVAPEAFTHVLRKILPEWRLPLMSRRFGAIGRWWVRHDCGAEITDRYGPTGVIAAEDFEVLI